jgi:hypothetical protein
MMDGMENLENRGEINPVKFNWPTGLIAATEKQMNL